MPTHMQKGGSLSLNAGSNPDGWTTDQRGGSFARLINPDFDMGATEGIYPIPSAILGTGPTIVPGASTYSFTVIYTDDVGIDTTTIGNTDVEVSGGAYGSPVNADTFAINFTDPKSVTVTYTITPPVGAGVWDATDNGTYSMTVTSGAIADNDTPTANTIPLTPLGSFNVAIGKSYLVDEVSDTDDLNYAPGFLSLREAIKLSNDTATAGTVDTINFDSDTAKFGTATTILTGSVMNITDPVIINAPAARLTLDGTGSNQRAFAITLGTAGQAVSIAGLTLTKFAPSTGSGGAINNSNSVLSLTGMHLTNNTAVVSGGAITMGGTATTTITDSIITGNKATGGKGGAVFMTANSNVLTVVDSDMSNNSASSDGGAVSTDVSIAPSMTFRNSLLSGNIAGDDGGAVYFYSGGAVTVSNSTFTGNSAASDGGAMYLWGGMTTSFNNNTISGNTAGGTGGGFFAGLGFTAANMNNTILAGNKAALVAENDVSDPITFTGDFNLLQETNGSTFVGTGNLTNVDPLLNALANNGGKTRTMSFKLGSPALNVGGTSTSTFDQRGSGFLRTKNGAMDIGAYEEQTPLLTPGAISITFGNGAAQRSMVSQMVIDFGQQVLFAGDVSTAITLTRNAVNSKSIPGGARPCS